MRALDDAASLGFAREDFGALERLVWDRSPALRQRAALQLTTLASVREAVETMRRLLHHRDHVVRMNAVHGLGLARNAEDERRLVEVLLDRDEHREVRATAAESLGGFRTARAVAALKRMVDDPSPSVRFFCIHALWHLRAVDAVRTIERRQHDHGRTPFGTVGSKARQVLRDLESSRSRADEAARSGGYLTLRRAASAVPRHAVASVLASPPPCLALKASRTRFTAGLRVHVQGVVGDGWRTALLMNAPKEQNDRQCLRAASTTVGTCLSMHCDVGTDPPCCRGSGVGCGDVGFIE